MIDEKMSSLSTNAAKATTGMKDKCAEKTTLDQSSESMAVAATTATKNAASKVIVKQATKCEFREIMLQWAIKQGW